MKTYRPAAASPQAQGRRTRRLPIPPFHAVPLRARSDGWTPLRQAEFIGMLAQTRSVAQAARFVGMGRESAYRLRRRSASEGFCAAWDAAMATWGLPDGALALPLAGGEQVAPRVSYAPNAPHHATRKSTLAELEWRVETGLWQVILHGGRYCGVRKKLDKSALLMLVRRQDALDRRAIKHAKR